MSSAELQSLMSQLQAQRQDPYLHAANDVNAFTYDTTVGVPYWYADGTIGETGRPFKEPHTTPRPMHIPKYEVGLFVDKARLKPFTPWETSPVHNDNGSIDWSPCKKEDMALMIAYERLMGLRSKEKLLEEIKEMKKMKAMNTTNGHPGHVDTTRAETLASELMTALIKLRSPGHKGTAATPPLAAKPRKLRKINPSHQQQQEEYQEREDKNKAAADRKGTQYKPGPSLVLREPGTYGPKQHKTP